MVKSSVVALGKLAKVPAAVFGYWLAERMTKRFKTFCCQTGYSGYAILGIALNQAMASLDGRFPGSKLIESAICYDLAPDSEEFSSTLTSSAIDAANVVGMLIDYINSWDMSLILGISSLSLESVDMLIQQKIIWDTNADELEAYITQHQAMIDEVAMQTEFVSFLSELSEDGNFFRKIVCKSIEFDRKYPLVFM